MKTTNLEQLLQSVDETTEETLYGGGLVLVVTPVFLSVKTGSGTLIPIKIKHNA